MALNALYAKIIDLKLVSKCSVSALASGNPWVVWVDGTNPLAVQLCYNKMIYNLINCCVESKALMHSRNRIKIFFAFCRPIKSKTRSSLTTTVGLWQRFTQFWCEYKAFDYCDGSDDSPLALRHRFAPFGSLFDRFVALMPKRT